MTDADPCGYAEILETLKTFFPVPVSNPILDGYFVHTLSRFLDQVDALKSAAPLLAAAHDAPGAQEPAFPAGMTSVEEAVEAHRAILRGDDHLGTPQCVGQRDSAFHHCQHQR